METQTIKTLNVRDKDINCIMQQCINLKEINTYLLNINKLAELCENGDLSVADIQLENNLKKQNIQLQTILQSKILEIILQAGIEPTKIINYARKAKQILGDVDMAEVEEVQILKATKSYIVSKIIAEDLNIRYLQQKGLLV